MQASSDDAWHLQENPMRRFPHNEIVSLVGESPRYDLAESVGPDLTTHALFPEGWPDLKLGYATAAGDPRLRALIAQTYDVSPDDVVITVGGMHALFLLAFTLCEAGEEAVVADPVFPLGRNVLTAVGAQVKPLAFRFDDGYQPDLRAFAALLTPKTRLVSLATPQNPSGVAIPSSTLREIVALMKERAPQAWLLLDETYREATYGHTPAAPSGLALGPRVVIVASLSKCHGAAGLRIGWAITRDAALRELLVSAKLNTVIACSTVDEAMALQVLKQRDATLGHRRLHLATNLALVRAWVARHDDQLEWVSPDAGALCCVRLKGDGIDDAAVEKFHAALASRGVRVAPGTWFGESGRIFRLGFGVLDTATLQLALDAVSAVLEQVLPVTERRTPWTLDL
jgi:aspartate/methionine/tyrosine aminotransferase